jgi:hypothetical protein
MIGTSGSARVEESDDAGCIFLLAAATCVLDNRSSIIGVNG